MDVYGDSGSDAEKVRATLESMSWNQARLLRVAVTLWVMIQSFARTDGDSGDHAMLQRVVAYVYKNSSRIP